jgi:steroid delta-isomerase-like uncharacterized protein
MKKRIMILPLVLMLCFIFGCQDKEALVELEEFRARSVRVERNKELVRQWLEAWNKGDFETFKEILAPEFALFYPSNSSKSISLEETIEMGKMLRKAFPDINWSMEELIVTEDKAVIRVIERGTHEGEFLGISAKGDEHEMSAIWISRIENGRIVEQREDFDMLGLYQQLGMELKPKEEK